MDYDFPYIGNNNPNWRTHIFQRGSNYQPGSHNELYMLYVIIHYQDLLGAFDCHRAAYLVVHRYIGRQVGRAVEAIVEVGRYKFGPTLGAFGEICEAPWYWLWFIVDKHWFTWWNLCLFKLWTVYANWCNCIQLWCLKHAEHMLTWLFDFENGLVNYWIIVTWCQLCVFKFCWASGDFR